MVHLFYEQLTIGGTNMIKLIASDMDGTLLGKKMEIPQENIEAIRYATDKGITFMVATGRGATEAIPVLEEANITCPMITVNGAEAFDETGKKLFTVGLEKETALSIIPLLKEAGVYFEIATDKGIFSDNPHLRIENAATMLANQLPHLTFKMAIAMASTHLAMLEVDYVKDYQELIDDNAITILKVIVFEQQGDKILKPLRQKVETIPDIVVTSSFPNNIEINHMNAQKGIAVKKYAEKLGIAMDEVMTIGDNFNDASMLELAGVSFAMGNAEEGVKKIARFETDNHDEGGVAKAIRRAIDDSL